MPAFLFFSISPMFEPVGFDNFRPFTQGLKLDAGPVLLFLGRRSRAPGFGARDSSREDWSQRDEQSPWGLGLGMPRFRPKNLARSFVFAFDQVPQHDQ